jgi:phosphinothricin acetyltransferase
VTTTTIIRACEKTDAAAIAEIYNYYVRETVVTFEETQVSVDAMAQRIEDIGARFPWLVWEDSGGVIGYAYGSAWKSRSAYRFAVESTIYLTATHHRAGIGTQLYGALLAELKARGFHTAIGGIALPNPASIALHEKLGFTKIGQFVEVGRKLDRWIDVGYWELIL